MNNPGQQQNQDIKVYTAPQTTPEPESKTLSLEDILLLAIQTQASDVHITSNYKPILRINGSLQSLKYRELYPEEVFNFCKQILSNKKDIRPKFFSISLKPFKTYKESFKKYYFLIFFFI